MILRALANQAKDILSDAGAIGVDDDWRQMVKVIRPQINEQNARRAGLTQADISRAIAERFDGAVIGVFREGNELRQIILEVVPDSEELLNYNIPAFTLFPGGKRDQQIMIAGYKKHVGLYPHPTTMEHFESELTPYKRGKGSVQIPLSEKLPKDLIIKMVQYRLNLLTNK